MGPYADLNFFASVTHSKEENAIVKRANEAITPHMHNVML
jgi:hypothetical protein